MLKAKSCGAVRFGKTETNRTATKAKNAPCKALGILHTSRRGLVSSRNSLLLIVDVLCISQLFIVALLPFFPLAAQVSLTDALTRGVWSIALANDRRHRLARRPQAHRSAPWLTQTKTKTETAQEKQATPFATPNHTTPHHTIQVEREQTPPKDAHSKASLGTGTTGRHDPAGKLSRVRHCFHTYRVDCVHRGFIHGESLVG